MRRSSYTPLPPEPLIVVEEAEASGDDEPNNDADSEDERMEVAMALEQPPDDEDNETDYSDLASRIDPGLLCPWRDSRDMRKRSLPTPSCTSGITASQVRRLSERSAATARESAFLATLTSAAAPGRRHSVTISRVPPTIYPGSSCRGRRESIAALPSTYRRDSAAAAFNLHLDIMDDIAEIKGARKAKMKLYNKSPKEQVCEIYSDETGSPVQYMSPAASPVTEKLIPPHNEGRRYSDSAGLISLMPPAIQPKRKSSEQFSGIICTNNDLAKLLSQSAQEGNSSPPEKPSESPPESKPCDQRDVEAFKTSSRSQSIEQVVPAISHEEIDTVVTETSAKKSSSPTSWYNKRHSSTTVVTVLEKSGNVVPSVTVPQAGLSMISQGTPTTVVSSDVTAPQHVPSGTNPAVESGVTAPKEAKVHKVVWDKPTGSVVDAQLLGSAIEVYLRRGGEMSPGEPPVAGYSVTLETANEPQQQPQQLLQPAQQSAPNHPQATPEASSTGNNKNGDTKSEQTCETTTSTSSSICSTFKDLFVK